MMRIIVTRYSGGYRTPYYLEVVIVCQGTAKKSCPLPDFYNFIAIVEISHTIKSSLIIKQSNDFFSYHNLVNSKVCLK